MMDDTWDPGCRQAREADIPVLLTLVQAAYRGSGGWTNEVGLVAGERITAEELRATLRRSDTVVMVVVREGKIVACCKVEAPRAPGEPAHLGLFAVDPARQADGIGRRLVIRARALAARSLHADTLEIHVVCGQAALLAWYERLGFAATGETIPFPDQPGDRALVAGLQFVVMRCPTRRPPYALSWSGGKDSALALHTLRGDGEPGPAALVTTVTADHARISMHGVRRELLHAQAAAVAVPLVEVMIPAVATNELYEQRMRAALERPPLDGVAEIAYGDLFLADIRAYREAQCAAVGRRARFPLWRRNTTALAQRFLELGFRAHLTCVDPARLDPSFAGREYDARLLAELPAEVDPCGEHGEFHTFVHDGPGFSAPIAVRPGEVVRRDGFVFADLLPA